MLSHTDDAAEICLGSNTTNNGFQDNAVKWKIISKISTDGRLVFSSGRFNGKPGEVDVEMMALKNVRFGDERVIEMYKNLVMKNADIVLDAGRKVNGVDISALDSKVTGIDGRVTTIENKNLNNFVTTDTEQSIVGEKSFISGNTFFKQVISNSGYIKSGNHPSSYAMLLGGATHHPRGPALYLFSNIAGNRMEVNFHSSQSYPDYSFYESVNEKKLRIVKGAGLTGGADVEMLVIDGNTSEIEVKTDRFKISKGYGQVTSGIGIRSNAARAQQFIMSNGDNVAEIYFGSDINGTGIADANNKWVISSRDSATGSLIFYRAPFYAGGTTYDNVMEFKNTLTEGKYNCVINMNKPVNFNSDVNIGGMPLSHFYTTDNWQLGGIVSPGIKMRIGRSGRNVTMNIGPLNPVNIPGSDILITAVYALDAPFHPSMLVENLFMITQNNKRMPAYVRITTDGVVNFWMDMNGSTTVQNPVRWSGFSTSWLA